MSWVNLKLTCLDFKISQFIKFCSSLNVEEHEDELSAVQYNKIEYPKPCSKGAMQLDSRIYPAFCFDFILNI